MTEPAKDEAELIQWMARGICCGNLSCENKDCHIDPICNAYNALAGILAAGWTVVPKEPTREMLRAGYDESGGRAVISIWEAMLQTAPGVKP